MRLLHLKLFDLLDRAADDTEVRALAGFKCIASDQDVGIDLDEPFLKALELHQQWEEQN